MNESTINEGIWSTWLQQAAWIEWIQPFLYILLALALVSVVSAAFNMAMLCWKEFRASEVQKSARAGKKLHQTHEDKSMSSAAPELQYPL